MVPSADYIGGGMLLCGMFISIIFAEQNMEYNQECIDVLQILFGLSFDMEVEGEDNEENDNYEFYESGCWNSSLQLRIENELSNEYFDVEFEEREEMNESSYAGSDTDSWLTALGQSLLQSLLLWQPLTCM